MSCIAGTKQVILKPGDAAGNDSCYEFQEQDKSLAPIGGPLSSGAWVSNRLPQSLSLSASSNYADYPISVGLSESAEGFASFLIYVTDAATYSVVACNSNLGLGYAPTVKWSYLDNSGPQGSSIPGCTYFTVSLSTGEGISVGVMAIGDVGTSTFYMSKVTAQ